MIPPWYVKMVLKNIENENGCETMFLHSDSPSCLHYKGLPSLDLGVHTHSYWKKQTRKNMEHIWTHTGKHNSWILIQYSTIFFASQDTPCDDSYTLCACWPAQAWRSFRWRTCLLNHHILYTKITVSYGLGLRVNQANKPRAYWPPNKLMIGGKPAPADLVKKYPECLNWSFQNNSWCSNNIPVDINIYSLYTVYPELSALV